MTMYSLLFPSEPNNNGRGFSIYISPRKSQRSARLKEEYFPEHPEYQGSWYYSSKRKPTKEALVAVV